MKKYIIQAKNNPLISGSFIIFVGSNSANVFNFLYNLFMSRNISAVDLGTLVSLISVITLFTVPASSLVPTIVNFAATFFAQGELGKLRGLFLQFGKFLFLIGIIFFVFSFLFARPVADFLHINDPRLITLAGLTIMVGYISTINIAFLQARLSFLFISLIMLIGAFLKFGATVLFIFSGFGITGALWGFFLAYIIPYILSFTQLRFIADKSITLSKSKIHELLIYGIPATVALFGITAFTSVDIILVKHFFSPEEAGNYAILAVVGKIIFFLTAPISTVMFPIVVQKYTKGENIHSTFLISLLLVLVPSLILTAVYFLFPEFIIKVVVNKNYSEHLGMFALYITGYSLLQVLTNFYLSIKKTNIWIPISIGAFTQAVLISIFHNSLLQVILCSLGVVFLLLIGLLLYYPHATKRQAESS